MKIISIIIIISLLSIDIVYPYAFLRVPLGEKPTYTYLLANMEVEKDKIRQTPDMLKLPLSVKTAIENGKGRALIGAHSRTRVMSYYFTVDSAYPYTISEVPKSQRKQFDKNARIAYESFLKDLHSDTDSVKKVLSNLESIEELDINTCDWLIPFIQEDDGAYIKLDKLIDELENYWAKFEEDSEVAIRAKNAASTLQHLKITDCAIRILLEMGNREDDIDNVRYFADILADYKYEEPLLNALYKLIAEFTTKGFNDDYTDILLDALNNIGDDVKDRIPIIVLCILYPDKTIKQKARSFIEKHPPYNPDNLSYRAENIFQLIDFSKALNGIKSTELTQWCQVVVDRYTQEEGIVSKNWSLFGIRVPNDLFIRSVMRYKSQSVESFCLDSSYKEKFANSFYGIGFESFSDTNDVRNDLRNVLLERLSKFSNDFSIDDSIKGEPAEFDVSKLEKKPSGREWQWIAVFRMALYQALNKELDTNVRQTALWALYRIKKNLPIALEIFIEEFFKEVISDTNEDSFLRMQAVHLATNWQDVEKMEVFTIESHPEALGIDWSKREEWAPLIIKYHPDTTLYTDKERAAEILKTILQTKTLPDEVSKIALNKAEREKQDRVLYELANQITSEPGLTLYEVPIYINSKLSLIGMREYGKRKVYFVISPLNEGEAVPLGAKLYTIEEYKFLEESGDSLSAILKDKDCIFSDTSPYDAFMGLSEAFELGPQERSSLFDKLVIGSVAGGAISSKEPVQPLTDGTPTQALARWDLSSRLRLKEKPIIHRSECPNLMRYFFSLEVDKKSPNPYQPKVKKIDVLDEDIWRMENFHTALNTTNNSVIREALQNFSSINDPAIRDRFLYHLVATSMEDEGLFKTLNMLHDIARGILTGEKDNDLSRMAVRSFEMIHEVIALNYAMKVVLDPTALQEEKILQLSLIKLFGFPEPLYYALYDRNIEIRKKALDYLLELGLENIDTRPILYIIFNEARSEFAEYARSKLDNILTFNPGQIFELRSIKENFAIDTEKKRNKIEQWDLDTIDNFMKLDAIKNGKEPLNLWGEPIDLKSAQNFVEELSYEPIRVREGLLYREEENLSSRLTEEISACIEQSALSIDSYIKRNYRDKTLDPINSALALLSQGKRNEALDILYSVKLNEEYKGDRFLLLI